ncbi:unnamed protein product [Mycena citricolor]|uniref:Uncharacterized protein n=1 Tax=Mycena citricolor TaxID=2018698 RepID=A0AAD2Q5K6_9AGAR|nr:unnamed protein product [Mycena citricolor]
MRSPSPVASGSNHTLDDGPPAKRSRIEEIPDVEMATGQQNDLDLLFGDSEFAQAEPQKNLSSSACTAHESTISYRFPSSSGSPSPPPIVPSSPDLAHQNQPGPSDPYLALPPPEDEIPDLDELPSEQPPSPPPHTPAPTMSGHHRITLAANPPYFDGDKSKYLGFVDACTTYIGAY